MEDDFHNVETVKVLITSGLLTAGIYWYLDVVYAFTE